MHLVVRRSLRDHVAPSKQCPNAISGVPPAFPNPHWASQRQAGCPAPATKLKLPPLANVTRLPLLQPGVRMQLLLATLQRTLLSCSLPACCVPVTAA
jgi:hypothetical protein